MSAGRRRMWWTQSHQEPVGAQKPKEDNEEEDGRFESEGSEGRVPGEGHAETSDRTEV
jgi:hypothetical protein|tara:strand:- start:452 stop:625 length:174 start_codon:yes stop_codon:yes gene_type:complete